MDRVNVANLDSGLHFWSRTFLGRKISVYPNERERERCWGVTHASSSILSWSRTDDILVPCLTIADKGDQLAKHIDYNPGARRAREVARG